MSCDIKRRSPLGKAMDNKTTKAQVRNSPDRNGMLQEKLNDENLVCSGNSAIPV